MMLMTIDYKDDTSGAASAVAVGNSVGSIQISHLPE